MTHPHQLTNAEDARRFVFAGNARLTLVSKKTGERFTYRVRAADSTGPATHFVSVLTGPDNEGDYTYLGFYSRRDGFRNSPKSPSIASPSFRAWTWFDKKVLGPALGDPEEARIPEQLEVWHEGRCGRCGRALTVPKSIASGLGLGCRSMIVGIVNE